MLDQLTNHDPGVLYQTCQLVEKPHAKVPGLRRRLIELLSDGRDWDCGQHVCAAAARALGRLDASWLTDAIEPFRAHVQQRNPDAAASIVAAVRSTTSALNFLVWCRQASPDEGPTDAGGAITATDWLRNWMRDAELIEVLLAIDEATRRLVLEKLVLLEITLETGIAAEKRSGKHVGRQQQRLLQETLAARQQVLEDIQCWTRLAPAELREAMTARAREAGLA